MPQRNSPSSALAGQPSITGNDSGIPLSRFSAASAVATVIIPTGVAVDPAASPAAAGTAAIPPSPAAAAAAAAPDSQDIPLLTGLAISRHFMRDHQTGPAGLTSPCGGDKGVGGRCPAVGIIQVRKTGWMGEMTAHGLSMGSTEAPGRMGSPYAKHPPPFNCTCMLPLALKAADGDIQRRHHQLPRAMGQHGPRRIQGEGGRLLAGRQQGLADCVRAGSHQSGSSRGRQTVCTVHYSDMSSPIVLVMSCGSVWRSSRPRWADRLLA